MLLTSDEDLSLLSFEEGNAAVGQGSAKPPLPLHVQKEANLGKVAPAACCCCSSRSRSKGSKAQAPTLARRY